MSQMKLSGVWSNYSSGNCPLPQGTSVFSLVAGPKGHVWMQVVKMKTTTEGSSLVTSGKTEGILLFDREKWSLFRLGEKGLPMLDVHLMTCDQSGQLWLYMPPENICQFNGKMTKVFHAGEMGLPLDLSLLSSISTDVENGVWIGTFSVGVYRFDSILWRRIVSNTHLLHGQVMAIFKDHTGKLWFAVQNEMLTVFVEYDGEEWKEYAEVSIGYRQENIQALGIDKKGALWVGWNDPGGRSKLGLWVLEHPAARWIKFTTKNSALPVNDIKSIAFDKSNRAWVGTSGGLTIFDNSQSVCWGAILPNTLQTPLDRHEAMLAKERGEERPYVFIGDQVVHDSLGQIWTWSSNGVSVFAEA